MFQDKMVTPAIPERVYALCKIVEKGPISVSVLKDKMEPSFLENNTSYFADYSYAAEELGLVSINDNMVTLAVEKDTVNNIENMRSYINKTLNKFHNGQFYKVTTEYFKMENTIFSGEKNIASLAPQMEKLIGQPVDAPSMRAWRFWASFLGFGYLQDMFFIPNAKVFLLDAIKNAHLAIKYKYSFGEFIKEISPYVQIIMDNSLVTKNLNYGFSNGLRALHDSGYIRLEHILDQEDMWSLYPFKAHEISGIVTNITILK